MNGEHTAEYYVLNSYLAVPILHYGTAKQTRTRKVVCASLHMLGENSPFVVFSCILNTTFKVQIYEKILYQLIVVFLCADCLEYIFSYFISTLHRAQAIEATQGNLRFLVRDGDSQSGGRSSLIEAWALIILQSSKWNHFDIVCPLIKGISVAQYVVGNFVGVRSNWWNRWEVENLFGARRRSEEVS